MNCKYDMNHMNLYLNDELSEVDSQKFKQHIDECEKCRKNYLVLKTAERYIKNETPCENSVCENVLSQIDKKRYIKNKSLYTLSKKIFNMQKVFKPAGLLACVLIIFTAIFVINNGNLSFFVSTNDYPLKEDESAKDEHSSIIDFTKDSEKNEEKEMKKDDKSNEEDEEKKNPGKIYMFNEAYPDIDFAIYFKYDSSKNPVLTIDDFVSYTWEEHTFELTKEGQKKLDFRVGVDGKPFMVVVDGKIVYEGAFWTNISSAIYTNPVIIIDNPNQYKIEQAYPSDAYKDYDEDLRDNQLIKDAFKRNNKLVILSPKKINKDKKVFVK